MKESRLTYREKCPDVCWQKQLRDKFLKEGTPPVPHLDVKRSVVREVSRRAAEQIIYKYEWLGTMSKTRWHYGLFYGNYCAGVVCVGRNITGGAMTPKMFALSSKEVLCLARGACVHWAPKGSNSRLVSIACKMLSRINAGKIVIAYSDTDAGEIGTIYQSCNWVYIGIGSAIDEWISPAGRIYNQMLPRDLCRRHGGDRKKYVHLLKAKGWKAQKSNPKHRYVYILDKSDRALYDRIEAMRKPYPKRAQSIDSDAPAYQQGEGGASPTCALQKTNEGD